MTGLKKAFELLPIRPSFCTSHLRKPDSPPPESKRSRGGGQQAV